MAVFVEDAMTASDGVLLTAAASYVTGGPWKRHASYPLPSGDMRFKTNRVFPSGVGTQNGIGAVLANGTPNGAEYDIEFDYYHLTGYGNFGVIARASATAKTFYHLYHGQGSGTVQEWVIALHVNGGVVQSWTSTASLSASTNYLVKFEIRDAAKKAYVWDAVNAEWDEVLSSPDNTITAAGRVGVRSAFKYGDNEGKQIGSFKATDLSSPPSVGKSRFMMIGD